MKIRNGFVSNSSSSSFVLVFKSAHEEILKTLNESERKYIEDSCVCNGGESIELKMFDVTFKDLIRVVLPGNEITEKYEKEMATNHQDYCHYEENEQMFY
jgi:hypothetical protein